MRRNQWIGGLALIFFGLLLLADQMGLKLPNGASFTGLFWPGAMIIAGLWFLFGTLLRGKSTLEWQDVSADLQGATSAALHLNHGAGELTLKSGASPNELFHGRFKGGLKQNVHKNGDRLGVRLRPEGDAWDVPLFGEVDQREWDMFINPNIPIDLKCDFGANKSTVDLSELNITSLKVNAGACDLNMTLPAKGRFKADFDIGAASCNMILPEGVSARIQGLVVAGDFNVDRRFVRNGKVYESPDYATATNAIEIHINGGAASVSVK